jgi:hypothetical protein
MAILVTDLGLSAITNAEAGGFLVNMTRFAVTEAPDVTLSVGDIALTQDPVYAGEVESIEVVSASTVKVSLLIPSKEPIAGGTWTLTEVGLYLESGELFAHGTFRVPYVKEVGNGMKLYIYVTAARLGDVINVTVGTNASLASAASVRTLVKPQSSYTNAVVVQDQSTNPENNLILTSGSLAVRYGAGSLNWGFLGYDLTYHGEVEDVPAVDEFILDVEKTGGFWLNDQEVVIVQIVSGPGAGESRRVRFDKETNYFTILEKNFSTLTKQSIINIWRATRQQLPSRTSDIDRNYVLGVGRNTWRRVGEEDQNVSADYIPVKASFTGNGARLTFRLSASIPSSVFEQGDRYMVFVGGKLLNRNEYSMALDGELTLLGAAPAAGVPVEFVGFRSVPSNGSFLTFATTEYVADGSDWEFFTSVVPDSTLYIMVFVDGLLVSPNRYIFAGTSITFTEAAPIGNVSIVQYVNFEELGASTRALRKEVVAASPVEPIVLNDVLYVEKRNTLVTIDGVLLAKDKYEVSVNEIEIRSSVTVPAGAKIVVVAFVNEALELEARETLGLNTGPQWVDPAGVYMYPNKIISARSTFVGNGATRTYSAGLSPDFAMVFVGGQLQDPMLNVVNKTNGTVTLPQFVPDGYEIDIVAFEAVEDDGEELICDRTQFTIAANTQTYTLTEVPAGASVQAHIISVGGLYVHASQYNASSGTIVFAEQHPVGSKVEVWRYISKPRKEYCNAIIFSQFNLKRGQSDYRHAFYDAVPVLDVGNENNTLLFGNTVMQMGTDYNVSNTNQYKFIIPGIDKEDGVKATAIVFLTGKSKTRLITREELSQRYMTRDEIMSLSFGGTGGPGGGANEGGGIDPTDPGGTGEDAKALFLNATSQIFRINADGTSTPEQITFTVNPQNIPGDASFVAYDGAAVLATNGNVATLLYEDMTSDAVTIRAAITTGGTTYLDYVTIVKLREGSNGLTTLLTNESHTLAADINGVVGDFASAMTQMRVYEGANDVTDLWTFTRSSSAGVTSTISANTVRITAMSVDNGYVDIMASRAEYPALMKRFSVAKSKTGLNGTNGIDGRNAVFAALDNEAFVFAASTAGVVTNFTGARSTIRVFEGSTDTTNTWTITKTDSAGVTSTLSGASVSVTGFSSNNDTGDVTLTASKAGMPTLVRRFSLTKIKGSSGAGSPGSDGKRGSRNFYISGRTNWNDASATTAAQVESGPIIGDTVMQYSNSFSQTRFWDGTAWRILDMKVDGNMLVDGSVTALAMAARSITAYNGAIDNLAVKTLNIDNNAVTQAQVATQPVKTQTNITLSGPNNPVLDMPDPTSNPVLQMVVTVTGTQPIMVWASWSGCGTKASTSSNFDMYYWGTYWKHNTNFTECVSAFKLSGPNGTYVTGVMNNNVGPGYTLSMNAMGVFTGVPAGTYTLSLCMSKGTNTSTFTYENYSVRNMAMAMLETRR